ncbi:hypothetical protein RQP46_010682 [Phenoliferia psychrophenolica]
MTDHLTVGYTFKTDLEPLPGESAKIVDLKPMAPVAPGTEGGSWTLRYWYNGGMVYCRMYWDLEDTSGMQLQSCVTLYSITTGVIYQSVRYKKKESLMVLVLVKLAHPVSHRVPRNLAWIQDCLESPKNFDVTFTFPGEDERTLRANSRILKAASPYFTTLLDAGFSEATPMILTTYCINITESSYKTYSSVLLWIHTGYINFALLPSSRPAPDSDATLNTPSSTAPRTSSPKSVYRLADYLDLSELKSLALAAILTQVDVTNVAEELTSDLSAHFEPVQEALAYFAVDNWAEVKEMLVE